MRVLFWVPYPTEGASNRYRIEQYLPYLDMEGIKYSLHPFWSISAYKILYKKGHYIRKCYYFVLGTISRVIDFVEITRYDVVFIHREAYPVGGAILETLISILNKTIVFDFDDAIFLPASSSYNIFIEKFKNPNKVRSIVKMSAHVIAGNNYLKDFARRYNKSVSVIPTSIDTDKYKPFAKEESEVVTIAWIGSATTIGFLNILGNVFRCLSEKYANLQFKIIGGIFTVHGLSNIVSKEWDLSEEINDLQSFDIGIMPMPDNEWSWGKCGFKLILYMSIGIPCVCFSSGVNREIITDGVNGFLVNTEEQWIEKLSLLITRPDLRKRMGLSGRKIAEERYSVRANALKFLEVLRNIPK